MINRRMRVFSVASILFLWLASCSVLKPNTAATPTSNTPAPTKAANADTNSNTVSANGQVVPSKWVNLSFAINGENLQVLVTVGQKVTKGQVLAHLDNTDAQVKLDQAKQALAELTSPAAIANAQLAVTNAEQDEKNAQQAYDNTQYWQNDNLIKDYKAKLVTAQTNLDNAQLAYNQANVGDIYNSNQASAYHQLYQAQQAYNNAKYNVDIYSQKPTQLIVDQDLASLNLTKATLTNAQNYLQTLTSGQEPDKASGADIQQLRQAKRDVVEAQKNVDETILNSPFDGSIVEVNGHNGELFSAGQPFIVMADFSTLQVQTTDMSEVDAGRVHVGDTAKVSFDALPASDVTGKVSQLALKNSTGSGVYYTVTIALDKIPVDLRWGMSAFVVVNVK